MGCDVVAERRFGRQALPTVSGALVRDIAYVVRVETLRSAPVIVGRSAGTNWMFEETLSEAIYRPGDQSHCPGRVTWRARAHGALSF